MNAARIGVLVLALVAAGAAAFLARGLVSSSDKKAAPAVVEAPTTEILVAADNIETGDRLTGSSIKWQKWPDSAMNPVFITRKGKPDALNAYSNSVARMSIMKGEPVTAAKLVETGNQGLMSALINPGMRAVAIRISPESSAGGFILPNDRVDVVLTDHGQRSEGGGSSVSADTIMRNVRVLAIDQRFNEKEGAQVAVGKTATLELTPAQAELVALAQEEGKLTLALRSIGDKEIAGGDEMDGDVDGSIVHVVRFGQSQTVRVK